MNIGDLCKMYSEEFNVTYKEAKKVVNRTINIIAKAILTGDLVKIAGLGTFRIYFIGDEVLLGFHSSPKMENKLYNKFGGQK